MTIEKAIATARAIKPNNIPTSVYLQWINEIEGRIQSEILLLNVGDIHVYDEDELRVTLLARPPHDAVYVSYLCAQIDLYNAEFDRYTYQKAKCDEQYTRFAKWFLDAYVPANDIKEEECGNGE